MRWAIWSASALLLATVSFAAGRFSSFHQLPAIVATLPGDESEFGREFDGRIRERFVIGSSEDKLVDFLTNEGFSPDWRRRDNPNDELLRSERADMHEDRACALASRSGGHSYAGGGFIPKSVHLRA